MGVFEDVAGLTTRLANLKVTDETAAPTRKRSWSKSNVPAKPAPGEPVRVRAILKRIRHKAIVGAAWLSVTDMHICCYDMNCSSVVLIASVADIPCFCMKYKTSKTTPVLFSYIFTMFMKHIHVHGYSVKKTNCDYSSQSKESWRHTYIFRILLFYTGTIDPSMEFMPECWK